MGQNRSIGGYARLQITPITFFLIGFAWMGFKRSLGFDDLYELPPYIKSSNVVPRFLKRWNRSKPVKSPKKTTVKAEFEVNGDADVKIIKPNQDSEVSVILTAFNRPLIKA